VATRDSRPRDHGDPGDAPTIPPPLAPVVNSVRPSAAEEARTIAASTNTGTLATLTTTGDPWASLVTYGLHGGAPVLCVSNLAEHGRNLIADQRASLAVVAPATDTDPLANARITLAGVVYEPTGADYAAAQPDPVKPAAGGAVAHLNADHADALAAMARTLGGYPDATAAVCTDLDRYGLDLRVTCERGIAYTRVGYAQPIDSADELRAAAVELTRRAREG
jgi:putative heme iron utilization protein